jgi:hypothetical protein
MPHGDDPLSLLCCLKSTINSRVDHDFRPVADGRALSDFVEGHREINDGSFDRTTPLHVLRSLTLVNKH